MQNSYDIIIILVLQISIHFYLRHKEIVFYHWYLEHDANGNEINTFAQYFDHTTDAEKEFINNIPTADKLYEKLYLFHWVRNGLDVILIIQFFVY